MSGIMNWTVFIIEAVALCAAFHLMIYLIIRFKPEWEIYSYPEPITKRWIELGKVPVKEVPLFSERLKQKPPAAIFMAALLGGLVYWLNGCRNFLSGFLVSYGLWLIVDWYDALILDCPWFCNSKTCVLPGTEDMVEEYHDYMHHIKGSITGMIIGLPVCLLIGLAVQIICWIG